MIREVLVSLSGATTSLAFYVMEGCPTTFN